MAYIGNTPADGEFKKADAISSTFNGVLTQFNIDYGTIQQSIGDPSQLIVSLNGVIQEPLTAYTLGIGGGSIIFASAPVSGDTCHIVILGGVGGTITPSDNSVTASKLSPSLKDFLEQNFVANGSQTTYTLSRAATGANTLLLSIDGILQPSSAFSVSGTTLTIDPALPNTTNVRVVHLGVVAGVYVPAPDSVTADMIANSINTDIATGVAALPKAGGAMTGPITTNSTFDGVDVGVRDGILTSTTTTANAALPKAGGTMTGNTLHGDNVKDTYGTGADLEIYHDGSNSYIKDTGTGNLNLYGNQIHLFNAAGTEQMIVAEENGQVALRYDGAEKFATTAAGVNVIGRATTDGITSSGSIIFDNGGSSVGIHSDSSDGSDTFAFMGVNTSNNATNHGAVFSSKHADSNILLCGVHDTAFNALVVKGSGRVGINTNSPGQTLEVKGNFRITRNGGASDGSNWSFNPSHDSAGVYGSLYLNPDVSTAEFSLMNDKFRFKNDGKLFIGTSWNGGVGKLHVQGTTDPVCYFHQNNSNDIAGVVMRHGRGLSGYSGKMVAFQRNDGNQVGSIFVSASATSYNTS